MQGKKYDEGKLPLFDVLTKQFPTALEAVAKASLYGHNKYELDGEWENFRSLENAEDRYANALMRHLMANNTEVTDRESGLPHIYHVAWNVLALIEVQLNKKL